MNKLVTILFFMIISCPSILSQRIISSEIRGCKSFDSADIKIYVKDMNPIDVDSLLCQGSFSTPKSRIIYSTYNNIHYGFFEKDYGNIGRFFITDDSLCIMFATYPLFGEPFIKTVLYNVNKITVYNTLSESYTTVFPKEKFISEQYSDVYIQKDGISTKRKIDKVKFRVMRNREDIITNYKNILEIISR